MTVYFDAVLDKNMQPLFNGTTAETVEWLIDHAADPKPDQVCMGKTMQLMGIEDYLRFLDDNNLL